MIPARIFFIIGWNTSMKDMLGTALTEGWSLFDGLESGQEARVVFVFVPSAEPNIRTRVPCLRMDSNAQAIFFTGEKLRFLGHLCEDISRDQSQHQVMVVGETDQARDQMVGLLYRPGTESLTMDPHTVPNPVEAILRTFG